MGGWGFLQGFVFDWEPGRRTRADHPSRPRLRLGSGRSGTRARGKPRPRTGASQWVFQENLPASG